MALGVVKSMKSAYFHTLNRGTLVDLSTGTEYAFTRPETTDGKETRKWRLETGDVVTFTIVNGEATNVVLSKKHKDNLVYSYKA